MASGDKIIVALSGGVDSAVAALCLVRAGHDVEALHMSNWEDDQAYCTAARDLQDARLVCTELGIPLHHVRFTREYRDRVFAHFLAEYRAGRTPNPDVLCNREIKFGTLLNHARRLGAAALATGHYARLDSNGRVRLLRAADAAKDQTYFLHAVAADALARARFPVGHLHKAEVRALANAAGLPVHAKRDSTGICFIGERPFREFLSGYLTGTAGDMVDPDGNVLGRHRGLMFYTPGQRQGLGIGGRREAGDAPWYVAGKDPGRNTLLVVQGRQHPALWRRALTAVAPHWIGGEPAALRGGQALHCTARLRHRQPDAPCIVTATGQGALAVHFEAPQWAVAPGQYVVFYAGEVCLGGAVIAAATAAEPPAEPLAASA